MIDATLRMFYDSAADFNAGRSSRQEIEVYTLTVRRDGDFTRKENISTFNFDGEVPDEILSLFDDAFCADDIVADETAIHGDFKGCIEHSFNYDHAMDAEDMRAAEDRLLTLLGEDEDEIAEWHKKTTSSRGGITEVVDPL